MTNTTKEDELRELDKNTFIGRLRSCRAEIGMALIRIGAEIALKNSRSMKLYVKHNGKLEIIGELSTNQKGEK